MEGRENGDPWWVAVHVSVGAVVQGQLEGERLDLHLDVDVAGGKLRTGNTHDREQEQQEGHQQETVLHTGFLLSVLDQSRTAFFDLAEQIRTVVERPRLILRLGA